MVVATLCREPLLQSALLPLHEWLLQAARDCGIKGGAAFRAIAGFGRHGHLHYGHFFEEAGRKLPVEVRLVTTPELAERMMEWWANRVQMLRGKL